VIPAFTKTITASAPPGAFDGTANPADMMKTMSGIMILAGGILGAIALTFLVTGLGSIFLKRWSRPFALFLSASWLYVGCLNLIWTLLTSVGMRQMGGEEFAKAGAGGPPPDAMFGIVIAITLTFTFIFGILLPGVVLWLNWHRDVVATLEFCDPKPRWTDPCPVPVLGISLAAVTFALGCLFVLAFPWFPVFGQMLQGQVARVAALIFAIILLGVAWGIYRQSIIAWAITLVLTVALGVSAVMSGQNTEFYRVMYESMGMPEELIEQSLKSLEIYMNPTTLWVGMLTGFVPIIAYLVWSLRFFTRKSDSVPAL